MNKHYTKPPLTYEQQADQLLKRGLIADKQELINKLQSVSYYRLSGYWHIFRNPDDTFKPNTSLEQIWKRYTFDRQLRLLVMDAIERVEISVRTKVVYRLSHQYGAFGYTQSSTLPKLSNGDFSRLIHDIEKEWSRSKEAFLQHYRSTYQEKHLPLWMAAEVMAFGTMLTMFRGLEQRLKQHIACDYGISDSVLQSWLIAINGTRNICAHHGRLWNRELGYKPLIPRQNKHPQWHSPVSVPDNRIFAILTILRYMIRLIAPQSRWQNRLEDLLHRYPDIPLSSMGFPANWKECPIWN